MVATNPPKIRLSRAWAHSSSRWLFNLGADVYDWFTANPVWRASCRLMADRLPDGVPLRVADLGCGPGVSAIAIARRRPLVRVLGVDVAARMLGFARRRAAAAGLADRIDLLQADATRLPFEDGSLDAATGHSFLYLLPDRAAALAEIARCLRPGGRIVLMEPSASPASLRGVLGQSRDPRHLVSVGLWRPYSRIHGRFSPDSLSAALSAAGFQACRVEGVMGGLGLIGQARKPGPEQH